jgi:glycosyltransferase involved in cell wall biosynthesis
VTGACKFKGCERPRVTRNGYCRAHYEYQRRRRRRKPDLAVLVPVLRRPHRVAPFLDSLTENTPPVFRVVFIPDTDDDALLPILERAAAERDDVEVLPVKANYARKINAGVQATDEPLLFFGADDLKFHPEWFERALRRMDDDVGVVSTNDLCNARTMKGENATHPLVARWYAESPTIDESAGPLYERYPHEYCDREFSEVARARGAFAYAMDSIVEHLHPLVGKAPVDDIYADIYKRMRVGRRIYAQRRPMWWDKIAPR